MGLTMSPGSVISQLDSMNENLEQAVLNAETMLLNVNDFLDTEDSLVGKAYDSARNYFGAVHVPVLNAMIKYAEDMIQENNTYKGHISSYFAGVEYIDEDALEKDKEFLTEKINHAYSLTLVSQASLSSYISCLEHAKGLIEEKLQLIRDFLAATAGLYQNIESVVFDMDSLEITSASEGIASIGEIESLIRYMGTDPTFEQYNKNLEAGKRTLINYLNAREITDPALQEKIYNYTLTNRSHMLNSLYITDCYSGRDASTIMDIILNYYIQENYYVGEKYNYPKEYIDGIIKDYEKPKEENGRFVLYNDGKTIAYGHDVQEGEDFSAGLSKDEGFALMISDLDSKYNTINRYVNVLNESYGKDIHIEDFTENEMIFLLDFAYNRGAGLVERKELEDAHEPYSSLAILIVAVSEGDDETIIQTLQEEVCDKDGGRSNEDGLMLRRMDEYEILKDGNYVRDENLERGVWDSE